MKIRKVFSNKLSIVFLAAGLFLAVMVSEALLSGDGRHDRGLNLSQQALAFEKGGETLPDIVERVVPAVVYIQSKTIVKRREVESPMMQDPFFRRFFEDYLKRYNIPKEREQQYLGSGVIVDKDGYILTNNHLVENANEVEVILPDKRTFDARIIGTDPRSDVAVLKIEAKDLSAVVLGNSEALRLGQTVLAIGYPYAVGQTVTRGIVSALGRSLDLVDYENFIQTDAAINPGNSGGALINTDGELVGINTAIYSRSGGSQGIGFAIPIELAKNIMDNLIAHGRVIRGYVGVVPQDVSPEMAEFFGLDEPEGVVISHVAENSPASSAGFEQGDVVVDFDGRRVKDSGEFRRLAASSEPGKEITVRIMRNGKEKKLKVTMGEHPSNVQSGADKQIEDRNPIFLGVALETLLDVHREAMNIPSKIKGVLIRQIDIDTPAAKAGLLMGDVIVEVNKRKIEDINDFRKIVDDSDNSKMLLLIYRNGNYFYTALRE
ncbi:MAG: DegQ family serine endoprotease [Candidatus Krumholzibacteriota bacterium]|nr:DegQ family serine endoprotease [Candidatus Krumholzibacteriota bacterium]